MENHINLENYADWCWHYNGNDWGFDPRIDNSNSDVIEDEKFELTQNQIDTIVEEHLWKCVRAKRNLLLKETDWVSGEDVPQNIKDLYFPYRQELRDITNQNSNPYDLTWPEKPE